MLYFTYLCGKTKITRWYVYHSQSWVVYYCFTHINHQVVPQKVGNGIPIIIVSKKNGSLGVYTPFSDKPKWRFSVPTLQVWRYPILKPLCQDFPGAWTANPINPKKDKSDWTSLTKLFDSKMGGTHEYMLNPLLFLKLSDFPLLSPESWMILDDLMAPCTRLGRLASLQTDGTGPQFFNGRLHRLHRLMWKMTPYIHIWIAF
jgi:hypothetical protein